MTRDDFVTFSNALPEFPGIQGREKYFNSAVLVPFLLIGEEYHLLFQKRASSISQGNEICFPGGKHDPSIDSCFKGTALRETLEEFGIESKNIAVVGQLDTIVAPMGVTVEPFIGLLDKEVLGGIRIDSREVEEFFTVPVSHFKSVGAEKYHVRLEIQPNFIDDDGEEITLLPSKELGLPDKYQRAWGGKKYRVLVYKTDRGVIWGITAEIIYELINRSAR
jgi:peroxisomal coenzyme A diphosphatase NUDT7